MRLVDFLRRWSPLTPLSGFLPFSRRLARVHRSADPSFFMERPPTPDSRLFLYRCISPAGWTLVCSTDQNFTCWVLPGPPPPLILPFVYRPTAASFIFLLAIGSCCCQLTLTGQSWIVLVGGGLFCRWRNISDLLRHLKQFRSMPFDPHRMLDLFFDPSALPLRSTLTQYPACLIQVVIRGGSDDALAIRSS